MNLAPTTSNFRAEIGRYNLRQIDIAARNGMNVKFLSEVLSGRKALRRWSAHNLGKAINEEVGRPVFDVDDGPYLPAPRGAAAHGNRSRRERPPTE